MTSEDEDLNRKLIRLGDMIADGLHLQAGGGWIRTEYNKTLRALTDGIIDKMPSDKINKHMKQRVAEVSCGKCGGRLKQNRSGSKRATCQKCFSKWQLLR